MGDERRRERVGRLPPGRVLGRVPGLEGEAEAAVVEVDARRRLEEVATEARGVRLDERHAHAVAVDDAQVRWCRRRRPGAWSVEARSTIDGGRAGARGARAATRPRAVGAFVQHLGAVVAGVLRRPRRAGGPRPGRRGRRARARPSAIQAARQRQVALRAGRDGPQAVARTPRPGAGRPSAAAASRGRPARTRRRRGRGGRRRTRRRRSRPGPRRRSPAARAATPGRRTSVAGPLRLVPVRARAGPARRGVGASSRRADADQQRRRREAVLGVARWPGPARRPSGSRPKRSCSASQPSTQPGTVTARMSLRSGICGVALGPQALRHRRRCRPARRRSASSGALDRRCARGRTGRRPCRTGRGVVTASTAFVAIAASTALPPSRSTPSPASVARWSTVDTIAVGANRVANGTSGSATGRHARGKP